MQVNAAGHGEWGTFVSSQKVPRANAASYGGGSGLGLLAGQSFVVWTSVAFGTGDGLSNRILTEIMIAVSGIIHRQMLY